MKVTVNFKNHTSLGRDCGDIEIRENGEFQEKISFEHRDWVKFRKGSGRGKADQKDYQAFVKFIKDQGPMQGLSREQILKYYY